MAGHATTTEYAPQTIDALSRLSGWDGLARIGEHLRSIKRQPNFLLVTPRLLRSEGVHSDLLAWLLDPKGWHGLGDNFAQRFVRAALSAAGVAPADKIAVIDVHREFNTGRGPVDLLIEASLGTRRLRLAVENKIDSAESDGQLRRYCAALLQASGDAHLLGLLLTPDGREPNSSCPVPVGTMAYEVVGELLAASIDEIPDEERHRAGCVFASHYLAALRNHIMPVTHPEIDALCRELYDRHQEAWRAIRRRLPSRRDEHHALIGAAVCRRLERLRGGEWHWVVRRDRYVCVYRPGWLQLGKYESDDIVGINGGSGKTYPKVHFRMVAASDETDADERFMYRTRLKVDVHDSPTLGVALVEALSRAGLKVKEREQFTIPLKSTTALDGMCDEMDVVPDTVGDWFASQAASLTPVIDAVFETRARS